MVGPECYQSDEFWDAFRPEFTNGPHVAWFIENYCTFTDGDLLGEPFLLEAWQRWLLDVMFEVDPATGLRRWREFILLIPRGNGKSLLLSALGFYFLIFDGEGAPEVYSSAWGEDQATAVFAPAKHMWDASPKLQAACSKFTKAISCEDTMGSWKIGTRVVTSKHGKKVHCLLNDELHVHPSGELRETYIKSFHKRKQPMSIDVTTEAIERVGPLEDLQVGFRDAVKDGSGTVEKIHDYLRVYRVGRQIMVRFGPPRWEEDGEKQKEPSPRDEHAVRMCNPLSAINVKQLIEDEAPPKPGKKKYPFLCYHMNYAPEHASSEGVPSRMWDACGDPDAAKLPDGHPIVVAVDVGYRKDYSAVVIGGMVDGGKRAKFEAMTWRPPREKGLELDIEGTVGEYVDMLVPRFKILRLIGDPKLLVSQMQRWTREGLPTKDYEFGWADTAPDSVRLLTAIQSGVLLHDGDEEFRRHVLNMRTKYKAGASDVWRFYDHPDKKRPDSDVPNDAGIALMMCAGELLRDERDAPGYAERGLLIL